MNSSKKTYQFLKTAINGKFMHFLIQLSIKNKIITNWHKLMRSFEKKDGKQVMEQFT